MSSTPQDPPPNPGSAGPGRLLAGALGALAVVVALVILVFVVLDDEAEDPDDRQVATAPANVPAAPPVTSGTDADRGAADEAGARPGGADAAKGTLVAGGRDLLRQGALEAAEGERVRGVRLLIVEVQGPRRFSVSATADAGPRVPVRLDDDVYRPERGSRIDLEGRVRGTGPDAYVLADAVTPQGPLAGEGEDTPAPAPGEDDSN